jgi:small-conductance mechanosensitive channel/CRP-like cAMP-binding protein
MMVGVTAFAVALGIYSFTINRLVRRKLRLSLVLLAAYVLLHLVLLWRPELKPETLEHIREFARLGLSAAIINLLVVGLLNPLRADRVPDRFPSIVQDAFVIGTFLLVATLFGDRFVATSAVAGVVLGFALQDTLGNAFAGLAIQSEKPFNIGHWITVGEHEGRVAEVTWRATKLRTKTGNFVIVPNSEVGKAPITNYSEPAAPMRLFVDVGVTYDAPPNQVKAVIKNAISNCPLVLKAPAPDAMIHDFAGSAITYRVRFWIADFELGEEAADQVRGSIFYAFRRHNLEIPYPIQTEISRELPRDDIAARIAEREHLLASVGLFAPLSAAERSTIAARMKVAEYGDAETIVREGDPGQSMFIVSRGRVKVVFEESRREIATLDRGDYFGEMSMLTGEPRTASVVADGDTAVLEIDAEVFRQLAEANPPAVEQVGVAAASRRSELESVRASTRPAAVVEAPNNFLMRMRRFLRI